MQSEHVAYLITYISFNYIYNNRGTIDETLIKSFLLDEVSEYIINNSSSVKFNNIKDVKNFWEKYGKYNVWDAYYVKNNNWIHAKPSDEDILLNIQEMTKSMDDFNDELKIIDDECLEVKKELIDEHIFNLSNKNILMSDTFSDIKTEINIENKFNEDEYENEDENEDEDEGEDEDKNIEFDWKTILNQEQEEQEKN